MLARLRYLWPAAVVVLGLIVFMVSMVSAGQKATEADARIAEIDVEMSDLSYELSRAESVEVPTETVVRDALYSASSAGQEVARLQNEYPNLPAMTNREEREANANALGGYFDEKSSNARTEWYGIRYADAEGLAWEFQSNYGFDSDTIPVLWLLKDANGELYAYTTADYNALTGKFENVVWKPTMIGTSSIGAS